MSDGVSLRRATARIVSVPLSPRVKSVQHDLPSAYLVLLALEDEDGALGYSCLWTLEPAETPLLMESLRFVAPVSLSARGTRPEEIHAAILRRINFLGLKGVTVFALSAFDMALSDLGARRRAESIADEIGRTHDQLPTYWSGLYAGATEAELEAEIGEQLERGFQAFKMRVGHADLAEDLRRVAFVRSLLPADSSLALDAFQTWSAEEAIRFAAEAVDHDVTWLEDPVVHNDYSALARVIASSAVPIATGENEYLPEGFEQLAALRPRYLLADLQRAGGISGWRRISELAANRDIALTPHLYPHVAVQLMATAASPGPLEFVTWWDPLISYELIVKAGMVQVPDVVGTGLDLDAAAVEHFAISPWQPL